MEDPLRQVSTGRDLLEWLSRVWRSLHCGLAETANCWLLACCYLCPVKLKVGWIGKTREAAVQALTDEYLKRLGRYLPTQGHEFRHETALQQFLTKERSRPVLVLLDARGQQMSSEELAEFLRRQQDGGTQALMFAVGPADGWSPATRQEARHALALSRMTLAHEVARVVLLEQLYRGFTILAGHPYHLGH